MHRCHKFPAQFDLSALADLVVKLVDVSELVHEQQLRLADEDVLLEQRRLDAPVAHIERVVLTYALYEHLDTQFDQIRWLPQLDELQGCKMTSGSSLQNKHPRNGQAI